MGDRVPSRNPDSTRLTPTTGRQFAIRTIRFKSHPYRRLAWPIVRVRRSISFSQASSETSVAAFFLYAEASGKCGAEEAADEGGRRHGEPAANGDPEYGL